MLSARKHAANLIQEGRGSEWLGENRTGNIAVGANAGDKQYGRRRVEAGKVAGELKAIHDGQQDVGHDKAELIVQRAGDGQSLFTVLGRDDGEALISQCLRQDTPKQSVILDQQHRLLTQLLGSRQIVGPGPKKPQLLPLSRDLRVIYEWVQKVSSQYLVRPRCPLIFSRCTPKDATPDPGRAS